MSVLVAHVSEMRSVYEMLTAKPQGHMTDVEADGRTISK